MTLVFKKHNGPTPAGDITPQIITDCGNLTLDFKRLGLWASPPFLQTLGHWFPNEIQNLFSSEKGTLDHWATVQFFFSSGKMPLTTTVAKFLETSVCGGSCCLDPSLSSFLVKFTQILESILLDNLYKSAVLSVGCASFSSTLFPSTQLSVNMLGYSTLWTASFFGNECLWLTLLSEGCQWLSSGQLSDQQSSPWLCSLGEPNWETILKAQETFAGVLSWLADWHVTIF